MTGSNFSQNWVKMPNICVNPKFWHKFLSRRFIFIQFYVGKKGSRSYFFAKLKVKVNRPFIDEIRSEFSIFFQCVAFVDLIYDSR